MFQQPTVQDGELPVHTENVVANHKPVVTSNSRSNCGAQVCLSILYIPGFCFPGGLCKRICNGGTHGRAAAAGLEACGVH